MTVFFFCLSAALMFLLPLALAVGWRRQRGASWGLFLLGVLTFGGAQAVHLPINHWLGKVGVLPADALTTGAALIQAALLLGLSTGLFETAARVVGYAVLFRRGRGQQWSDGVMVGLRHGGIEAMGFVAVLAAASFSQLWTLQGTDLSTLNLTAAQTAAIGQQLDALRQTPWVSLLAALERGVAIGLHVILSLLVWTAFKRRNPLYALLALLYHAAFDATAVYVDQTSASPWAVWAAMTGLSLPGVIWLWHTWPRRQPQRKTKPREGNNQFPVHVQFLST